MINLYDIESDGADAFDHDYALRANPYIVSRFDGVRKHDAPRGYDAMAKAWAKGWRRRAKQESPAHGAERSALHHVTRKGIVADRLRAASEFRQMGEKFDCLVRIIWARSNRQIGKDSGQIVGPAYVKARFDNLGDRLWLRHIAANQ